MVSAVALNQEGHGFDLILFGLCMFFHVSLWGLLSCSASPLQSKGMLVSGPVALNCLSVIACLSLCWVSALRNGPWIPCNTDSRLHVSTHRGWMVMSVEMETPLGEQLLLVAKNSVHYLNMRTNFINLTKNTYCVEIYAIFRCRSKRPCHKSNAVLLYRFPCNSWQVSDVIIFESFIGFLFTWGQYWIWEQAVTLGINTLHGRIGKVWFTQCCTWA